MKKFLVGLLGVLVIGVAALVALPPLLDNSLIKSRIAAAVKDATGRDMRIGELRLAVLPAVQVSLRDVGLSNAEDMPSAEMVKLGRLDLEIELWPLIAREILVERMVISDLAAALEVNAAGEANWIFPKGGKPGSSGVKDPEPEAPFGNLRLGDVRLENARIVYRDLRSGQSIEAENVDLEVQMADAAARLTLNGGLDLNGKAIGIDLGVEPPIAVITGRRVKLAAAITSELVDLRSELDLAEDPRTSIDGQATIEVTSVGAALAWLGRPLPEDQPDPGPLRVAATFQTEGAKVLLREAVVEGEALDLKADGSVESIDGHNKVALRVESGVLDIDRYLPPPVAAGPAVEERPAAGDGAPRRSPMEVVPDDPLDLLALRRTEADISVAIAGIKAAGYEVGGLAVKVEAADGKLRFDLSELSLYGGGVSGRLGLDASGEVLGVEADFAIEAVDLGALTAVAGTEQAPVAGVASGRLSAKAAGASPRALVQGLEGNLAFKLGEIDVKDAAAGTISGVDLTVDLPGWAQSPRITGELIYNRRKLALDLGLAPLDKIFAEEAFALQARAESDLLKLTYDGNVQHRPLPGLDGRLDLASPSIGKLAAWLGRPLPEDQPDPGPVEMEAKLAIGGAEPVPVDFRLSAMGASLGAKGSIAHLSSGEGLDLLVTLDTVNLGEAARRLLFAGRPVPAFAISGTLTDPEGGYALDAMQLRIGGSDLMGKVLVSFAGQRPRIEANLGSKMMNLTDFAQGGGGDQAKTEPDGDGRMIPDVPLPFEALEAADLNLSMSIDRLVMSEAVAAEEITLDADVKDGKLSFRPRVERLAEGRLEASLSAGRDGAVATKLTTNGVILGTLLKGLGMSQAVEGGPVEADLDLRGRGSNLRQLIAQLDGRFKVAIGPGSVETGNLDLLGGDLLSQIIGAVDPFTEKRAVQDLNCGVIRATLKSGIAAFEKGIGFQTDKMDILGAGTIDLSTEGLDLGFDSEARSGLGVSVAGIVTPLVRVRGTLADPRIGVSAIGAVGNAAEAAAGIGGSVLSKGMALLGGGVKRGTEAGSSPCQVALGPDAMKTETGGETAEPEPGGQGGALEGVTEGIGKRIDSLFGN